MASGQACRRRGLKKRYINRKSKGICVVCGKNEAKEGNVTCKICSERASKRSQKHYAKCKGKKVEKL